MLINSFNQTPISFKAVQVKQAKFVNGRPVVELGLTETELEKAKGHRLPVSRSRKVLWVTTSMRDSKTRAYAANSEGDLGRALKTDNHIEARKTLSFFINILIPRAKEDLERKGKIIDWNDYAAMKEPLEQLTHNINAAPHFLDK